MGTFLAPQKITKPPQKTKQNPQKITKRRQKTKQKVSLSGEKTL
jgi:hypothetical protein